MDAKAHCITAFAGIMRQDRCIKFHITLFHLYYIFNELASLKCMAHTYICLTCLSEIASDFKELIWGNEYKPAEKKKKAYDLDLFCLKHSNPKNPW